MSPLGGVIFDLDGTLYHEGPMRRRMLLELGLGTLRLGLGLPRALGAWRKEREALRGEVFPTGLDLEQEQLKRASHRSGIPEPQIQTWVHQWMEQRPLRHLPSCAREDLRGTFEALSKGNISIGVFSDHPVEEKLQALGVADLVQASCSATSEGVGAFKPDPRGFLLLAGRMGLVPEQVLVVGDRQDADGAGAQAAGMQFCLLGSAASGIQGLGEVLPLFNLKS